MPTGRTNIIDFTTRRTSRPPPRAQPVGTDAPLRVLIIDDTAEDRMVVRFALEAQGFLLSEADNGERGIAAAISQQPDCILLDSHMPDLSGLEVLEALRQANGTLPYVVVVTLTGSGDAANATKLLQAGALDYVNKQHLDGDNLRRAVLGAVERFRLLEDIRRADVHNAQLAAIVTASADAMFSVGLDHIVQTWNPGATELFGYTEEQAVGHCINELIVPPEKVDERAELHAAVAKGHHAIRSESVRRHKDGSDIPVDITVSPMLNDGGIVVGVSVVMRDIREQKSSQSRFSAIQAALSSRMTGEAIEPLPETRSVERSSNESRLMKVREAELLDAVRDQEFDQITRLASSLLNAPISLMTVIDDSRQFFVSSYGLGEPLHSHRETPLGASYCRYVIESGRPIVIQDASRNPLVADIGAWKDSFISYLAVPVLQRDGVALASLCVADSIVRAWTRQEQHLLEGMANLLLQRLETREAMRALRRSEKERQASEAFSWAIFESSPDCLKVIDADGRIERMNANGQAGMEIDDFEDVRGKRWSAFWPAEDRGKVAKAVATARAGDVGRFTGVCHTAKGTRKWWDVMVSAVPGESGGDQRFVASSRDITEHRAVQEALRHSELRYRSVFDHAATGIIIEDGYRRVAAANASFCALLGYTEDQLRGMEFRSLVHPDDLEGNTEKTEKLKRGEITSFEIENRFVHKDGHSVYVRKFLSVLPNSDGETNRLLGLVTDITERKRTERALAQQAALIDLTADAVIVRERDGTILSWNSGATALYGFTPEEAVGCINHKLLGTRFPLPLPVIEAALQRDGKWTGDVVHRTRDGRQVTVLTRWQLEAVSLSHERGVLETNTDITERKNSEAALRTVNATFRHLVENSPFGIYTVDADFRLVQLSLGARKSFENVRPLIGRDVGEILRILWPEPLASEIIGRFRHTLATGEAFNAPSLVGLRHDTANVEAYDWKIERITLPDGRPGVVCHFYDLSERQRHEEQVHLLMREVNHRAKNMLGLIQAVARRTAATTPADFMERFEKRIQGLSASQDVLVRSDWKAIPIGHLVRSQLAHFGDETSQRISITGPKLELTAAAAQTIGMALHELSTNAAKYGALSTTTGSVEISWNVAADDAGEPRFNMNWIEVGGPPVSQPARRGFGSIVIDGMVRMGLGSEVTIDYQPTGLAWKISCAAGKVVEGGVVLGLRPPRTAEPDEAPAGGVRRVLVVEDEPLIAMEIASILADANFLVVGPAGSVAQALALIEKNKCDAAVLDLNLGLETAEPIAHLLTTKATPFIIVSGYSREQQPVAFADVPHIGKPVQPQLLVAEVKRCLQMV